MDLVPKHRGDIDVSLIPLLNRRVGTSYTDPVKVSVPSLAYSITQVTIFIFAKAVSMVR